MKKRYWALYLLSFILVLSLQFYLYTILEERQIELENKQQLQNELILFKINQTSSSIIELIKEEQINNEESKLELQRDMLINFQELQEYVNKKTSSLEVDFKSQISGVDNQIKSLEEKNYEIENRIDSINVESGDFTGIIEDVMQTVVSIKTESGQGSGFFFDKRGYIMTNRHVIEGSQKIYAIDSNSKVYQATVIAIAGDVDLAILKIEGTENFKFLKFEDDVEIGQRVIAVGNPLGYSFSVTEGIISATNRKLDSTNVGYIQIDVPINPGNSGGPLVNSAKKVVGINTFKSSTGEGIGFSIPSNVIEAMIEVSLPN